MSLNIGIIGLPNVGKSTTFNALTQAQQAEVANYPFTTIEPNRAVVTVPDARLDRLAEVAGRQRVIHATIEFVDIAGLVRGASKGEGLGNQFLAQIRDVDALLHIVRCFEDPNVTHVSAEPEPQADIDTVKVELALADLEQLERKMERLESEVKGDGSLRPLLDLARDLRDHLDSLQPAVTFPRRSAPEFLALNRELRFLTAKPVLFVANVDEAALQSEDPCSGIVREHAAATSADALKLCADLESALAGLPPEEKSEMLALAGLDQSGLDRVIERCYRLLGLISFFSMNEEEVRAWTVRAGTRAPQAAGVIHSDFERGFIRAEVMEHEAFIEHGSAPAVRAAGALRSEGKEYAVRDGDLILFRFNV